MPSLATLAAPKELSHERQALLKTRALSAVSLSAVFSGFTNAMLVLILQPFPGTSGDPIMRTLLITAITGAFATFFKFGEVVVFGKWIESQFNYGRMVSFRDVFSRETARSGVLGGSFQAVYLMLFVALATTLSPGLLASARAVVVIPLVILEAAAGLFVWRRRRRLVLSLTLTLSGALLVIAAGGVPKISGSAVIMFLALITSGNIMLAWAECEERRGVSCHRTAISIYTLTRFVYFTITCVAAVIIWGLAHKGFGMVEPMLKMVFTTNRFWLVLPLCFISGCADLFRLAAKPVISATQMYVIFGTVPMITVLAELLLRVFNPKAFAFVPTGPVFLTLSFLGTAIIIVGAKCFPPHERLVPVEEASHKAS